MSSTIPRKRLRHSKPGNASTVEELERPVDEAETRGLPIEVENVSDIPYPIAPQLDCVFETSGKASHHEIIAANGMWVAQGIAARRTAHRSGAVDADVHVETAALISKAKSVVRSRGQRDVYGRREVEDGLLVTTWNRFAARERD